MKKRHRLLTYDAFGRWLSGRILLGLVIVFSLAILDFFWMFLGNLRLLAWGSVIILLLLWFFLFNWIRNTAVYLRSDHLQIQGPFFSLRIPYKNVLNVSHTRLSDHFTPEQLSVDRINWLAELYYESCALVLFRDNPVKSPWRRRLFSSLMFPPGLNGLLLLVPDWIDLARGIEAGKEAQLAKTKVASRRVPLNEMITPGEVVGQTHLPLVLVADDSPAQCKHIETILQGRFRFLFATNGIDALRLARDLVPDLILATQHLGNINGLQLLAAVRKTKKMAEIPFIFMDDEPFPKALAAGANDVVVRPIMREDLIARIENWLRIREQIEELRLQNEKLHGQTLNQMAELVRKGELVNFLPKQVAQSLMSGFLADNRENLHRQKVTILFVDMVGFTALTGRLNPNVLSVLVNDFLREMTAIAIANQGTVDKFIGDEVMVIFGAPEPQDDFSQVRNAAKTALGMLAAIKDLSSRWETRLPVELSVRIGFNTGFGTAGVFGDELLRTYTVVGSVVNIAARLRAAAQPGQIVCSAECFDMLRDEVKGETIGQLQLKGIDFPVEAYALLGRVAELAP